MMKNIEAAIIPKTNSPMDSLAFPMPNKGAASLPAL